MALASFEREAPSTGKGSANLGLIVALVVFVLAGLAVEVIFLPKASFPAGSPRPSEPAKTAFDQWVSDFESRNVTGLSSFYAENATITWSGEAPGLAGTYVGLANIRILYGSTIGKDTSLNVSVTNYTQKEITPLDENVTFFLSMTGNNTESGDVTIQVNASQDWGYVGGHWQVVKETWNYLTFDQQFVCCSTTFPQWSAMKEGLNPNLVSDKGFEWHAGPYAAASVYAFLVGVLAIGFVAHRRGHEQG
jgi:hypothetical protein